MENNTLLDALTNQAILCVMDKNKKLPTLLKITDEDEVAEVWVRSQFITKQGFKIYLN